MQAVKIIYLGKRGGGSNYTEELSRSLIEIGIDVELFISSDNENLENFNNLETKIYFFKSAHSFIQLITRINNLFKFCIHITREKKNQNTIFHFTMFHVWNLPSMLILKFLKRHIVFTVHDYVPHTGDGGWIMKQLIKIMVNLSDKLVVLNSPVAEQILSENSSINEKQIIIVPLLSFAKSENEPRTHPTLGSELKVLFFGRISEYKGIKIFLESALLLKAKYKKIKYVVAGNGDLSIYKNEINALGKSIDVINKWIDEKEIEGLFKNADLCILPYIDSTQSGIMPIALSYGVPIVITPSKGLICQLPNGTGVISEGFSAEEVSTAITSILFDSEKYEMISKNAIDHSKSDEQSWLNQARMISKFYEDF